MTLIMEGPDPKWFQENMGRGGAIPLDKRAVQQSTDASETETSAEEDSVIDLSDLDGWPIGYFDVIASETTSAEQRMEADHDEYMCDPIGRLKMMLGHRGIPRKWVVQYGWPGMLVRIREYAAENNIRLIEPESYLTGKMKVPHV